MTQLFLDRIDSAPISYGDFPAEFNAWLSVLVDSLNEIIVDIQDNFNGDNLGLVPPSLTAAEITALATTASPGTIWYCTDHIPPCLVALVNGTLVQISTAAFP